MKVFLNMDVILDLVWDRLTWVTNLMFWKVQSNDDADHKPHTNCINNMKQDINKWLILHSSRHPDANTIELSSVKIRPVFSRWTCRWCSWQRAGGGYPGGSSPIPPPSLWLGWWSRPDVIAGQVLKYLSERCAIQQTWNKNLKRDITHTCLFHVQTQTQSWLLQKHLFFPSMLCLIQRKPPLISGSVLIVRDSTQR